MFSFVKSTKPSLAVGAQSPEPSSALHPTAGQTDNVMNELLSVLVIAGWSTREPDQPDQVERHLPSIFKAMQDLRKVLGEDVTSMDMEVGIVDPGKTFNPTYMEDGYEDARASSGTGNKIREKRRGWGYVR